MSLDTQANHIVIEIWLECLLQFCNIYVTDWSIVLFQAEDIMSYSAPELNCWLHQGPHSQCAADTTLIASDLG